MIALGANPFVVHISGTTQFDTYNLSYLDNLPTQKSIFFPVQSFACCNKKCDSDLSEPWFYKTGTFPGKYKKVIGKGASSTVLRGIFQRKESAFKFVEIVNEKNPKDDMMYNINYLNKQLNDMTSVQSVSGNKIVQFYGHFR